MQQNQLIILLGGPDLILFGIVVLIGSQLIAVRRDRSRDDLMLLVLKVIAWSLIAVGTLGFAGSCVVVFGVAGLWLWMIAAVVLSAVAVRRGRVHRTALLWTMTVSAERMIPLAPVIEAFAEERRGWIAAGARRLAELIRGGMPLPEALRRCRGVLPPDALPIVRVGYESGALAPALRHAASVRDFYSPVWHALTGKLVYLCVLPWIGFSILTFIMWKIVPSFIKIFDDFDAELPALTRALIAVSNFVCDFWILFWLLYLGSLGLCLYAVVRYIGWTHWNPPGVDRLIRRLHTAAILDALALAAGQDRPMLGAVSALAESYPHGAICRRLRRVAADIHAGADWCESLYHNGLLRQADLAVLQAAQRVGNLPWALKEMADSNRRRLAYRLYAVVQLLFPPILMCYGAVALFVVVALFIPLISLIVKLT